MDEELDRQVVADERDRELGLIAAAHAALDPGRRTMRADILVESVLQVLRKEPLQEDRILQEVQRLWNTRSISAPLVNSALLDAQAANLVALQQTLIGMDWTVTSEGLRDIKEDALWAQSVLERFEEDVRVHLDDDANRLLITDEQVPKIATKLREAMMMAAQGLYALDIAASPGSLRPLRFNDAAAFGHINSIQPKAARQAASRLLISAINPHDTFADELVHLLVTANILHGMVTRRDLGAKPNLKGVRLAVDTSVLVDLPGGSTPGAKAVEQALQLSKELGAEVIVSEHTVSEWMGLFDAADEEMKLLEGSTNLGLWGDLLANPFTRAFSRLCVDDSSLSWPRFRADWRDPTRRLQELGVTVRPHYNMTDADKECVQKVRSALARANRKRADLEPYARRLRTASALDADAQSAAMVARWRRKEGSQAAYFVAQDRMTGRAYSEAFPEDRIPLAVTLTAWLTLAAALTTEDPKKQADCADIVKNMALRESFLAIAASYTYQEVSELAAALATDTEAVSPGDVSEFVQQAFEDIEQEITRVDKPDAMRLRGARLLSSRAARRGQRARHAEETTQEQIDLAREEERVRGDAKVYKVVKESIDERAVLQQQLIDRTADVEQERAEADERVRQQKRVTFVACVLSAAAVTVLALLVAGSLTTGKEWKSLFIGLGLVIAFCVAYIKNRNVKWWYLLGTGIAGVLINEASDLL